MYLLSGKPAPHCRIVANVTQPRRQDADPAWPQPESEPEPTYGRDTMCSRGTSRPSTRFAIDGFTDCEEKGSRRFQNFRRGRRGHWRSVQGRRALRRSAQSARPAGNEATVRRGRLAETKEVRTPFRPSSHFRSLHSGLLMRVGVLHDSIAHCPEVLAALAEPDAPHSRKSSCVCRSSGSTRPHTDAATALRVCILVEYSVTLAVLDFFVQENFERH